MRLAGRKFQFPQAHDITSTYPYRAIQAFVNKCRSQHFDADMIKETVKTVVRYAKDNNLLSVGPSILNKHDIVDQCCKMLDKELKDRDYVIAQLTKMNDFIKSKTSNRVEFFAARPKRKGYPNLIALRSNNTITDTFIALSRSAVTVLNQLECSERAVLSSVIDMMKLRLRMMSRIGVDEIKAIFGDDANV